ncbi:MAG: hypothetical protein O2U61_00215 [Candidatus Bathyarchaeota archaeon]|nr:hypothetical protein [Candidatus Bathyarchaeota archaeon]
MEVNPGGRLCYQYHYNRAVVWTMLQGTGHITLDGEVKDYKNGETALITLGAKPRIENATAVKLVFIKARQGWSSSTPLEEGIQKTYQWFLENRYKFKEVKLYQRQEV